MHENAITYKMIQLMNRIPSCFARKRHGGAFSQGDPDIAGVIKGFAFFCEVKLETGELTKLQAVMLNKWKAAAAYTSVAIYSVETRQLRIISMGEGSDWITSAGPIYKLLSGFPVDLNLPSIQRWIEPAVCCQPQNND